MLFLQTLHEVLLSAPSKQDNVLLEYEYALLRNWIEGTPVVPIFAADIKEQDLKTGSLVFEQTDTKLKFPDVPHKREQSSQQFFNALGYNSHINVIRTISYFDL